MTVKYRKFDEAALLIDQTIVFKNPFLDINLKSFQFAAIFFGHVGRGYQVKAVKRVK